MLDHQQRFMAKATALNEAVRYSVPAHLLAEIQAERRELASEALLAKHAPFFEKMQGLQELGVWRHSLVGDTVTFTPEQIAQEPLNFDIASWFKPWKKGPFQLGSAYIDTEWRSDLKWQRIAPLLKEVAGKRVLDIGAHNGYYMYRLEELNPAWVLGLEPYFRHALQFYWFNCLSPAHRLHFELLGVEHLAFFPQAFDVVLCLGIIYHFTDPIGVLRHMRRSLDRGGIAIIDCQGIPGEGDVALLPRVKYMGNKGFWWLPTESCLKNMIHRAGFKYVDLVYAGALTNQEQRATDWASISSLADRLEIQDGASLTQEGYPGPWRFYFVAHG